MARQRSWLAARVAALLPALALALGAAGGSPQPALADHGGPSVSSLLACDRPVDPPRCVSVGNDRWQYIYIHPAVPDELAASVRDAMAEYDATELVVVEQPRITSATDAIVFATDYGPNGAAGWVNCPPDAPQGTNQRGHRWCQRQEIHFNLNPRYAPYFADDGSRDYMACHEIGHTLGLRHWGNPPNTDGPAAATCLQADTPDGPTSLHALDRRHLDAYYASLQPASLAPRPLPLLKRLCVSRY